ncbi:hypothetical protein D9615_006149 [Tricholomella constricta]|uniref:Reverse transcriptase n=1 Tax=Tricholomella constricta TaxID=117010 RepID=A0A8H5M3R3_9AGAR|nr:hypothetical protein D9615_006149 [Tricholomella constricta]
MVSVRGSPGQKIGPYSQLWLPLEDSPLPDTTGDESPTPQRLPGPPPTEAGRQGGDGNTRLLTEPAAQPTYTASNPTTNTPHPTEPTPNTQQGSNTPNPANARPATQAPPRTITDHFNPPRHAINNKILRANIRIGSYNIRGGGSRQTSNKWDQINQIMREDKLGILAVQETHLTRSKVNRLNGMFEKRLLIINSSLHRRTNAAGVAIILNKQWTAWNETHHWEIVPGQALLVQIPWKNSRESTRTILAIYAPNDPAENRELWITLQRAFRNNRLPNPNFMIGDFNIIEDALDRIPAHEGDASAVEELRTLKNQLNLIDGWRTENGEEKAYSYLQSTTFSQSRIDRIYINPELYPSTREWEISHEVSLSDHNLVSVQYFDSGAPKIGRGRWSIPQYATDDEEFIKNLKPLLAQALSPTKPENVPPEPNSQQRLKTLKTAIKAHAKKYVSEKVPESKKKIAAKERELKKILNEIWTSDDEKKERAAELEIEIRKLQLHHHLSTRERTHLKFAKENELIGKTWINVNKDIKGRDQILALQKPEPEARGGLEYNSDKMVEIARKYHSEIQSIGKCYDVAREEREKAKEEALNALDTRLTEEESEDLNKPLTAKEIREAVYNSAAEKSPGLDGIPTEIWRALTKDPERIDEDEDEEEIQDAACLLRDAFNDIIENGILTKTGFAAGWMSPIFKKKDKTKIENYRPITVLNADYKIMTKTAGFMKGRRIENQTDLIRIMIDYGQNENAKGLLIFLDQEKAYDKILHDFLYETLERMNFPPTFIQSVKSIYGSAWTKVMINGCVSDAFKVTRGVRQGDPLSCLLFNFAIESLACMIRKSHLKGFPIPNTPERLIISMFADDTTVFLAKDDRLEDITALLERWCIASGAKFNVDKTEIIPIGDKEYRDTIIRTRGEEEGRPPIPANIKIARQGEPVRALGAFVGNGVENGGVWTPTIEDIENEDLGAYPRLSIHNEEEFTTIYTDGSGIEIGTTAASAGGGVFFGDDDPRNVAFRLPNSLPHTNNAAEVAAVLAAVEKARLDEPITINSDSKITIQAISQLAIEIEDLGWIETSNREVLEPLFAMLRNRTAPTNINKVKAHSGIHGNERADNLANEGAHHPTPQIVLLLTPNAFKTTQGARLHSTTQALLYKGIRKIKASKTKARRQTTCHLDIARHEIEQRTGRAPTDKAIWSSLRKGHLLTNKRARQLIWKLMHHGLPIGEFWNQITNYEHRAECRECGTTESPEHIFTECKFSGQETIWKTVKTIFKNKKIPWRTPSLGTVLGCGISELTHGQNKNKLTAADRLYTIIIAEASQQIWRTRCD